MNTRIEVLKISKYARHRGDTALTGILFEVDHKADDVFITYSTKKGKLQKVEMVASDLMPCDINGHPIDLTPVRVLERFGSLIKHLVTQEQTDNTNQPGIIPPRTPSQMKRRQEEIDRQKKIIERKARLN